MISYTIKINSAKTATIGNLQNVVKQVEYTVTGTDGDQSFSLPVKAMLEDPAPETFIGFNSLTEAKMIEWVAELPETVNAKEHVNIVVQKMVAEGVYQIADLPWAPPSPASTTPTP